MAEFFNRMLVGINKGVNSVSEGSKNMMEKAKLHTAISDAEKAKAKLAEQLGNLTHSLHQSGTALPENLVPLCEEISAYVSQIAELKQRLDAMEPEKSAASGTVCPACGTACRPDSKFCANCGGTLS
ncbi:MAG: zinc ribbon domain-containing protein [Ruminococcaceae bacterium]|nr:zinc ribbon domain-containing protein [Oscillospiraceae bacterium]